jgi:hypothetical protein
VHHYALPDALWFEAIKHSAYLLNRCQTKALDNKTPEEAYTNTKQDVSKLRIFGTRTYVQIPKHKCDKLASKVLPCILVGLDEHTKGYRCYNPTSKKIIITRDITFDESRTLELGASTDGRETTLSFLT